tara:strand:+ start:429 stop:1727 length:1299 start_codon:yes stop_codon:yes gene_type:complete
MTKLILLPDDKEIPIKGGETILTAVLRSGIPHLHACGGVARCSTCRIEIKKGLENCNPLNEAEKTLSSKLKFPDNIRLACQTKITGDVIARRLLFDKRDLKLANQLKEEKSGPVGINRLLAIMFVDIEGFTPLSENLPSYDVMYILNRYFDMAGDEVKKNGGEINNYIGDAVLALFGLDDREDEVFRAVKSGLAILDAVENFRETVAKNYNESFHVRVGIHFGEAIVGMLGSEDDKRLSVIGESVNMASRVEAANKDAETRILISEEAYKQVENRVEVEDFVRVKLKGMSSRSTLYEIKNVIGDSVSKSLNKTRDDNGKKWHRLISLRQLSNGSKQVFDIEDTSILLINYNDNVHAIENNCPHMNMPLEMGQLSEGANILCPYHDSEFCVKSGKVIKWVQQNDIPTLEENMRSLKIFNTDISDDVIWVSLDS